MGEGGERIKNRRTRILGISSARVYACVRVRVGRGAAAPRSSGRACSRRVKVAAAAAAAAAAATAIPAIRCLRNRTQIGGDRPADVLD
jgi:hypothetical protein